MDGKAKIKFDFAEEECIDLSIAFTPACSLYVVLKMGLAQISHDIGKMDEHIAFLDKPISMGDLENPLDEQAIKTMKLQATQERSVALLAYNQGCSLMKELSSVIEELEPSQNKKKVLIHKPSWTETNT